jgi:hypothetical protein
MIVRDTDYADPHAATHFGAKDAPCFFCGEPVGTPFIIWAGHGGQGRLVLHLPCAIDIQIRMTRDVHELKQELGLDLQLVKRSP